MRLLALACSVLFTVAQASDSYWQLHLVGDIGLRHSDLTPRQLLQLERALFLAQEDLARDSQLKLCEGAVITVHPTLASYEEASGADWFQLAMADRSSCTIELQRLLVTQQHGGVEHTLRHELFHLAQPDGWERWRAEGEAQRFAGERPTATPLMNVSEAELNQLLAAPPSNVLHLQAMATAYRWVMQGR